jgi:hypothetical protein
MKKSPLEWSMGARPLRGNAPSRFDLRDGMSTPSGRPFSLRSTATSLVMALEKLRYIFQPGRTSMMIHHPVYLYSWVPQM